MGRKAFTDRKCHSLSAQRGCHSQNKSPPRPPASLAISIQPRPRCGPSGLGPGSQESLTRVPSTGQSGQNETRAGDEGKRGSRGRGLRPQGTKSLIRKSNAQLEGGASNSRRGRWICGSQSMGPKPRFSQKRRTRGTEPSVGHTASFWISRIVNGISTNCRKRAGWCSLDPHQTFKSGFPAILAFLPAGLGG